MNTPEYHTLQSVIRRGVQAGLWPEGTLIPATMTHAQQRPWPVVLLTALGAWLAAIPLMAVIVIPMSGLLTRGVGAYVMGLLMLGGAVMVLRAQNIALFVEQLAVPVLMAGAGILAMGVFSSFPNAAGYAVMLVVALAIGWAVPRAWLRVIVGMLAAGLSYMVLLRAFDAHWFGTRGWSMLVMHLLLGVWLLTLWLQTRWVAAGSLLESMGAGWILTALTGLALASGGTFLVGGATGTSLWDMGMGQATSWYSQPDILNYALRALSCALVVLGLLLGTRAWPASLGLRRPLALGVAVVLAALAWYLPTLGAALLTVVVCATTHRARLAAAAAVAAAWIVGSFYYRLDWTLAHKALVLCGAGAALGALAWLDRVRANTGAGTDTAVAAPAHASPAATPDEPGRAALGWPARWWVGAGIAATLLLANGAIWQKQQLIEHGQRLLLPLAPMDPRSLMQGDYMRLRFPALDAHSLPLLADMAGQRPLMVVRVDARGVASPARMHNPGQALSADERLLELSPKDGNWVVVTDAWFFKEGDGARWQAARFGDFRVLPNGKALLVGMTDEALHPIQ